MGQHAYVWRRWALELLARRAPCGSESFAFPGVLGQRGARRLRRSCRSSAKSPFAGLNRPTGARWQPQEIRVDGAPASNVDGEAASPREGLHATPPRVRTSPLANTMSTTTAKKRRITADHPTAQKRQDRPPEPHHHSWKDPSRPERDASRDRLFKAELQEAERVPPPITNKQAAPTTQSNPQQQKQWPTARSWRPRARLNRARRPSKLGRRQCRRRRRASSGSGARSPKTT